MKTTHHPIGDVSSRRLTCRPCPGARALAFLMVSAFTLGAARAGNSTATPVPQPSPEQMDAAGLSSYPVAPNRQRVDFIAAPFSNSTRVNNPLFPIGNLHSVVLNGMVGGKVFRVETN